MIRVREKLRHLFRRRVQHVGTPADASPRDATPRPNPQEAAFSSDQPIKSKEQDRFYRWPFASRIAETLAGRSDPSSVVIGIYGPWGDGKTSTLHLMEEALEKRTDVIRVPFNPWHFDSEEQLLRGFFATLAEALGKSLSTRAEEVGRLLKEYGSLLSLASVAVGPVTVGAGEAARGLGEALSTVTLDERRKRLERLLREQGKRIVVLIDDIDRLDRREIQALFRLIKLSASFDYTSYVLAFDDEMVAGALGERYGSGGAEAGRAFLEKIVQVPLHLPPADELALRRLVFEGAEEALGLSGITLTEAQAEAFGRHFVDGIEPRLKTPRQAKLYGNAIQFALPILKGEVNPVDQMLIEGIRIFYPKLYVAIRDNPDYFLKGGREDGRDETFRRRATELINAAFEGTGPVDRERVRRRLLEVLFPRLGNTNYGSDWDTRWDREQRVCSREYFARYFHYGVPPGDVSDVQVTRLVDMLERADDADVIGVLGKLAADGGMRRLVYKLRQREDIINPGAAARLALLLSRSGSLVPRERGPLIPDWTFSQAAILVRNLARRAPPGGGRRELAHRVIREAEPLAFAFECFKWLRKGDDEPEGERTVPVEIEAELGTILVERVRAAGKEAPLYRVAGADAPRLFWLWNKYGRAREAETYLRECFERNPAEVDDFLATCVGKAWGLESGLSHPADFDRHQYDAVAQLISPDFLLEKLKERYGAELDAPEFYLVDTAPLARRIAHQFAHVHQAVQSASRQNTQPEEDQS